MAPVSVALYCRIIIDLNAALLVDAELVHTFWGIFFLLLNYHLMINQVILNFG